jgi:hypothetical protein
LMVDRNHANALRAVRRAAKKQAAQAALGGASA